jgi:hypothetical protein
MVAAPLANFENELFTLRVQIARQPKKRAVSEPKHAD